MQLLQMLVLQDICKHNGSLPPRAPVEMPSVARRLKATRPWPHWFAGSADVFGTWRLWDFSLWMVKPLLSWRDWDYHQTKLYKAVALACIDQFISWFCYRSVPKTTLSWRARTDRKHSLELLVPVMFSPDVFQLRIFICDRHVPVVFTHINILYIYIYEPGFTGPPLPPPPRYPPPPVACGGGIHVYIHSWV